ncbi:hypothetical protein FRC12_020959 [Ceratobasidium sp. 428]|nr:hypothetical protein FRC12_020959 [Ceratobasidium sp. 428]
MEVVKRLLEARLVLERAATEFLDACTALKTTAYSSLVLFPSQIALENVVQGLLTSVESAGLVKNHMEESRAALNRLLNMSPTRVPINRLPPEILGRVFSFVVADSTCSHEYGEDTLMGLPLVCTKWHQVSTSTPSLWTHIDISFGSFPPATALGRAQKLLDWCRNMPVHIHFDGGYDVKPADVPDIMATLQPHVGFLSSLYITNTQLHSLISGLLGLTSGPGAANSLKCLSLYDISETDSEEGLRSLPVYMFQGLTQLELADLDESACPSMGGIARVLSGCPALHTLQLRKLETPSDPSQDYTTVSLSKLRFLEITQIYGHGEVPALLSKITPGALELDVRLDTKFIVGRDGSALLGQLFLARANVVSLFMNPDYSTVPGRSLESLFACVPRLRVLHLDGHCIHPEVPRILGTKSANTSSPPLALLQSLCLSHCEICPETAKLLKEVIEGRALRNLVLLGCTYPPSFTARPNNWWGTRTRGSAIILSSQSADMPENMKEWFLEHVERVIIDPELRDAKVYHGRDVFVQGLITID